MICRDFMINYKIKKLLHYFSKFFATFKIDMDYLFTLL